MSSSVLRLPANSAVLSSTLVLLELLGREDLGRERVDDVRGLLADHLREPVGGVVSADSSWRGVKFSGARRVASGGASVGDGRSAESFSVKSEGIAIVGGLCELAWG